MTDLRERALPGVQPVPTRLPWHLRKAFLLPVLGLLLLGALPALLLQAAALVLGIAVVTGGAHVPAGLDQLRGVAEGHQASSTSDAEPTDDATAAATAAGGDTTDAAATVQYVVTGDVGDTDAQWVYDADGAVQSDDTLGSTFTLTMDGSEKWPAYSITVRSPSGRGSLACKVLGADGEVLAHDESSGRAPSVTCSTGS